MNQPDQPGKYYAGLEHLKAAIGEALVAAGARMDTRSIFHPRLSRDGIPPENLTITAVPLNGPRSAMDFERAEIHACYQGVTSPVLEKIDDYVRAFQAFRKGPDRNLRSA